jgi:hypothetical protein
MKKETKSIKVECGNPETFYSLNDGAVFGIAFDKIFEKEGLETFNEFAISSKRYFKNMANLVVQTYDEIFIDEGGKINPKLAFILFKILNVKSIIMSTKNIPCDKMIEYLDDILLSGNKLFLKTITKYVSENMVSTMDKCTEEMREKKRKINKELQMTDAHGKTLVILGYTYRLLIPVIAEYLMYVKQADKTVEGSEEDTENDDVCSAIFAHIFELVVPNPTALRNKLYRLVESRITKTTFSDKKFWDILKKISITKETEALDIYKKLLTNAIPKISISENMNIVGFLQAVVHNQVDFLFQRKFKYKLTVLEGNSVGKKTSTEDDIEDFSDFEKVEFLNVRKNEGSHVIRKLSVLDVTPTIPAKLGVAVESAEIKETLKTLKRNSIKEQIVSMIVLKYFDDPQAIKYLDFYNYTLLVLACKKFLIQHKFVYLPMILTATCEKHKERVSICGKKVRPEIMRSKKYSELFAMKYRNFSDLVDIPFLGIIGTTYSSEFKNEAGEELFNSSVKVPKIAEELIDLAYLI